MVIQTFNLLFLYKIQKNFSLEVFNNNSSIYYFLINKFKHNKNINKLYPIENKILIGKKNK